MSKTRLIAPRARGQRPMHTRPGFQADMQRPSRTPPPTTGGVPNAGFKRPEDIGSKAAAQAFRERAGKRGKAPPLIRRR